MRSTSTRFAVVLLSALTGCSQILDVPQAFDAKAGEGGEGGKTTTGAGTNGAGIGGSSGTGAPQGGTGGNNEGATGGTSASGGLGGTTAGETGGNGGAANGGLGGTTAGETGGNGGAANGGTTFSGPPSIESFTVDYNKVCSGSTAKLRAVFKNGIGTVDGGVGELTTGVDKITSAITANATYTLTVTGSEGQKVTKAVDVTALPSGKFTPTGAPNGKTVIPLAEVPHAVLPNGDVIANPDRMERYRLSTGEFESLTLSSPCSGRPHHLQALTSGLVLVTGCEAYEGAHMLDPETGNMTRTASLSMVREYPAVTLIHNDRVLFSGGCFGGADGVRESAELFDPKSGSNGSFALLTMTVSRSGHSSTLLDDGSVLLAGGMSGACGGGTILGAAELYVTSTTSGGSFVPTKSMNVVRRDHAAALIANGNVLITGGYNQSISPTGPVPLSSAEIFEKSSGTFRLLAASLTQPRWAHAMLPLKNGRIIIIGGDYSAEIFNPISETFTSTGSSPRTKGSAAVLPNGMVFLVGIDKATWNPSAELYCP